MYRYSNGQISLSDLKQPVGMNLKESNRWVISVNCIIDLYCKNTPETKCGTAAVCAESRERA